MEIAPTMRTRPSMKKLARSHVSGWMHQITKADSPSRCGSYSAAGPFVKAESSALAAQVVTEREYQ